MHGMHTLAFPKSLSSLIEFYFIHVCSRHKRMHRCIISFILSCELIIKLTQVRLRITTAKYIYKNGNLILELRSNLMNTDLATSWHFSQRYLCKKKYISMYLCTCFNCFSISRKIHLNHKKIKPPLQEHTNLPHLPQQEFVGPGSAFLPH